ncbi:MAG: patatin-like phospholipase family protein [Burkholderiaceae bacterium]|nr:patatin-like phospholipase family protein [Burkholderiaceae bacterium]
MALQRGESMGPASGAPTQRGRIGLALAGGGFLAAAWELGALCALSEAIEGFEPARLDAYVGVSAGSFVAAGLVNGVSPHRMVQLFVEGDSAEETLEPSRLLRPAFDEWRKAALSLPRGLRRALRSACEAGARHPQAALWQGLDELLRVLPDGLVDGKPAEQELARLFGSAPRTNDFRCTRAPLRIVATDIDSGMPVAFGSPGYERVPISRAAVASSAVPGLFPPVRIGSHRYVDGALNKTLHASLALDAGAGLVFCLNPLVPFDGSRAGARRVSRSGPGAVLSQTMRATIRSRMTVGLEKYRVTHPQADIVLFEPRRDDAEIFFANIFSVASRRRLCEHAYRTTRANLLERRRELAPVLQRHGLSLDEAVLHAATPRLVREPESQRVRVIETRATIALRRLSCTLHELERSLAIARTSAGLPDTSDVVAAA